MQRTVQLLHVIYEQKIIISRNIIISKNISRNIFALNSSSMLASNDVSWEIRHKNILTSMKTLQKEH